MEDGTRLAPVAEHSDRGGLELEDQGLQDPQFRSLAVKVVATLALATLAYAGNYFNLTLFFGVDLLFGSVATLLALVWLGTLPALAVALTGGAHTWLLWGHPYAMVIFTLEIAAVAWHRRRVSEAGQAAPPLAISVAIYWITLGIPLVLVAYLGLLGLSRTPATLIALKQSLNGLLNAALAELTLTLVAIARRRIQTLRMADILFTALLIGITAPSLGLVVWQNTHLKHHLEQDQASQMRLLAQLVAHNLDGFPQRSEWTLFEYDLNTLYPWLVEDFLPSTNPRLRILSSADRDSESAVTLAPTAARDMMLGLPRGEFASDMARWRAAIYHLEVPSNVPAPGSRLVLTVDASALIERLQNSVIPLLGVLLALTLGAVLTAYLFTTWISRPVVALIDRARSLPELVKAGRPSSVSTPSSFREMSILTNALNAMSDSLGASFASLQTERQRLDNVIEGTQAGAWEWDLATNETRLDRRLAELVGYDLAELSPSTLDGWYQLIHPDDLSLNQSLLQEHIRGETAFFENEYRARHKDGHWVWIFSRGRVVERDAAGTPLLFSGITLDISAHKDAALALIQSERLLRTLVDTIPDLVWMKDPEGVYLICNRRFEDFFGASEEEIVGRTDFDFVDQGLADFFRGNDLAAIAAAEARVNEEEVTFASDGHREHLHTIKTPVHDTTGALIGVLGVGRDITPIKEAEQALKHHQDQLEELVAARSAELLYQGRSLRALIDNLPHVAWLKDREGRFLAANRVLAEGLGLDPAELLGKTVFDLWPHEIASQFSADDIEVIRTRQARTTVDAARSQPGDRYETFRAPIMDTDGEMLGTVGFSRNVQPQLDLEAELARRAELAEAAAQAKGAFLANMSHEIRTPLNAVVGMSHLIAQTDLTREQSDYLGKLQVAVKDLLGLIDSVLDFSKIESDHLELDQRPFNLEKVLKKAVQYCLPKARDKDLALRLHLDPRAPRYVEGDALRLAQVLSNLIGNAVKFTDSGEVDVRVTQLSRGDQLSELAFAVRDTGIGLTQAQQGRIFDAFTQAEVDTSHRYGGTGLGLSICDRLVRLMGGELGVVSQVGQGSTFGFTLRLTEAKGAVSEPAQVAPLITEDALERLRALDGAEILVVDDLAMNREIVEHLLERAGLKVTTAVNGQEAIDLVQQRRFAAVLMDVKMPVVDGRAATEAIRQLGRTTANATLAELPIIAMTAYAFAQDRTRCLAAGMSDHVSKPIEPETLYTKLLEWIDPATLSPSAIALPPATRATSGEAPLPRLPGVDMARGLRTTLNDPILYRKLLLDFMAEHGDSETQLRLALAAQDWEQAKRWVHDLKTEAGSIGALATQQAATQLESALQRREVTAITKARETLDGHLREILSGLAELTVKTDPTLDQLKSEEVETTALLQALQELLAHVNTWQPRPSQGCFARIREQSWPRGCDTHLASIERSLSGYRFDLAAGQIQALMIKLEE